MKPALLTLILALTVSMSTLAAERRAMPPDTVRSEGMFTVSERVVTPHTAWAKPYAGKAPRVLFIVPRWKAREVVEIAQRLTMDYAVVMTDSSAEYSGAKDEDAVLVWAGEFPPARRPSASRMLWPGPGMWL